MGSHPNIEVRSQDWEVTLPSVGVISNLQRSWERTNISCSMFREMVLEVS